jgi:hypothetical protein
MSFLVRATDRRAVRHAVELSCCVVREKDSKLVGHEASDLSPYGMRVDLRDVDVDIGDRFFVCFRATQMGVWFYTDALATRILHGRRPLERGRSLGLRFRSLDAVSRLILRGALRKIPPPLPQRELRIDYAATVGKILAA